MLLRVRAAFFISISVISVALALAGCSGTNADGPDGPPDHSDLDAFFDANPQFEADDVEQAQNSGWLTEFYCNPAKSKAQYAGCLAHVTPDEICEKDTEAKRDAVASVDFVADPCDRDKYAANEP